MMLTNDQLQELIDNTVSKWLGSGIKLTDKTNKSKYILLQTSGFWKETSPTYIGVEGYYWSTTFNYSSTAYGMHFRSNKTDVNGYSRRFGCSIRPVRPL